MTIAQGMLERWGEPHIAHFLAAATIGGGNNVSNEDPVRIRHFPSTLGAHLCACTPTP